MRFLSDAAGFAMLGASQSPLVLPASTRASLIEYWGLKQIAGYNGAAAEISTAGASQNVGFANTVFDKVMADTFAAGAASGFSKWYGQVAGLTLANATFANMPINTPLTEYRGFRPLTCDGAGTGALVKFLRTSGTWPALNRQSMTVFMVVGLTKTQENSSFWEFADAGFTTQYAHLITNTSPLSVDAGTLRAAGYARVGPQILSVSISPTTIIVRAGGRETVITQAASSQLIAALQIGQILFSGAYNAACNYSALAVYTGAFNSAQMQEVEGVLAPAYALQDKSAFNKILVIDASSLQSAYQLTKNQNPPSVIGFGSGKGRFANVECFNMSLGGRSLATAYANRAIIGGLYDGIRPFGYRGDGPSNDISNTTYTSQADAETGNVNSATAIYNNFLLPLNTYVKGLGGLVTPPTWQTVLARTSHTAGNFKSFAAAYYNNLLKAGAAAAGHLVTDTTAVAQLTDPTNTTFFNADGTHLNDNGSANYLDPLDAANYVLSLGL